MTAIHRPSRRRVLQGIGAAVAAASLPPLAARAAKPVKIGYVSPETGPLAPFGAADQFVIAALRPKLAALGITVEVRDSQSDSNRAATVANDLINEGVALMLVSSTPETTNPVSDQCGPLAGLVLQPWRQAGRGLHLYLPFLLGARGCHRHLHGDVGATAHQQGRGRAVPQ
jgi:ABC-type branched-subunit amino acid transport system substrate-binding protein